MFGLKLFLNEALEGFWSGARKQKSDGETPGSIRAGTVPAVSTEPFIKPRHSKISIDLIRLQDDYVWPTYGCCSERIS